MKRMLLAAVLACLLCALAWGDVVHTYDGRKIAGKVVREEPDFVVVKTRYGGEITIDRADIERIERGKLPEEIYEEKAGALKENDAEGHYELGQWCKEEGLGKQAKEQYHKAVAANPEHEAARKALGYVKKDGKWILPKENGENETGSQRPGPSGVSSAQLSKILKLVEEAVRGGTLTDTARKQLDSPAGLPKKDFEKVQKVISEWKKYDGQNQQDFTIQVAGMQTFIHLPPGYDPKKPCPLIISLHGAGGNGQNLREAWVRGDTEWSARAKATCIVAAPTWQPARWWLWPQSKDIVTLLDELKDSYNVDTNRVLLGGFSNGAHSAWSVGIKQPSLFTALGPSAGLPIAEAGQGMDLEMIAALGNLPVHLVHSADDRICPANAAQQILARYKKLGYDNIVHKQYPSGGHVAHREYWGEIFKWFSKMERDMYPDKTVFMTDHQEFDTAYWIRLSGVSPRATVKAEVKGTTVKLEIEKAGKVTVFLSDRMMDLDKPVKIEINGKNKFSGTVKRSACTAVEEALRRKDRNAVYAASIELDVP